LANNKKARDRVSQLKDIIDSISLSNDMKGLLETALNKTLEALSSEKGSIFLTGDDGQELFLRWAYDTNPSVKVKEVRKRLGEDVVGKVAMNRKGMLVKDIRHDSRFHISNMYHDYKTNSFLSAPIATDMKLIGVINITENKFKKPYSEGDLKFLEIVADRIALKIEKSQLMSEMERLRNKRELDTKFADLGKVAGGVCHEINSPLDGVIRYVNLALMSLEEGVARKYLLEAKGGLGRIANIIRSLLELTRRKKPLSVRKQIDVTKAIENSIDILRYEAMCKAIDIRKHLADDLPKIPDLGLETIFSNIFKNAFDAMDEKGCIDIATSLEGDFIKITICDTGCGIPKDNIGRIFEPFFTTKETTKGVGLGLSISYDIVKRYNGRIDALSEPNKGTKFAIYIPCGGKK